MPQLVGSLCAGEVSLDKVRALADVATPETDSELCDQAKACTVRQLADTARTAAQPQPQPPRPTRLLPTTVVTSASTNSAAP